MRDPNWHLETVRRSLVMCASDGPATSLTNRDAADIIATLQLLERRLQTFQEGVASLLEHNSPVPRQNAQLRRLCADLSHLLAASGAVSRPFRPEPDPRGQ